MLQISIYNNKIKIIDFKGVENITAKSCLLTSIILEQVINYYLG